MSDQLNDGLVPLDLFRRLRDRHTKMQSLLFSTCCEVRFAQRLLRAEADWTTQRLQERDELLRTLAVSADAATMSRLSPSQVHLLKRIETGSLPYSGCAEFSADARLVMVKLERLCSREDRRLGRRQSPLGHDYWMARRFLGQVRSCYAELDEHLAGID